MLSLRSSPRLQRIPSSFPSSSNLNTLSSSSSSSLLVISRRSCPRSSSSSRAFTSSSSLSQNGSPPPRPGSDPSSSPSRPTLSWKSIPSTASSSPSSPSFESLSQSRPALNVPRYPTNSQPEMNRDPRRPAYTQEDRSPRSQHQLSHLFPPAKPWAARSTGGLNPEQPRLGWKDTGRASPSSPSSSSSSYDNNDNDAPRRGAPIVRPSYAASRPSLPRPSLPTWGAGPKPSGPGGWSSPSPSSSSSSSPVAPSWRSPSFTNSTSSTSKVRKTYDDDDDAADDFGLLGGAGIGPNETSLGGHTSGYFANPVRGTALALPAGFVPLSPYEKPKEVKVKEKGKGEEQFKPKDRRGGPLRTRGAQDDDELREKGGGSERRQVNSRARVDRWGNELTRSEVFIPNTISVERLAVVLGVRLRRLQVMMIKNGLVHNDPNHVLSSEDASIVAEDMGFDAKVDVEKSFDIYPAPIPADMSAFPLRPPIVTIMGHVDHGKTTLLDTLRKASVAKGEAGGITQHIGAFSVSVPPSDPKSTQPRTICFLDTPGHAAFTAMRARGAQVTDIIILVVAADDGVMPQSREVIKLVEETPNVQLVVAINKIDKHKANAEQIKAGLATAGVVLEDLGGDVPSVEVSGLTGLGLDSLMETVSTLAEVAELRAEVDMPAEGYVLESQIERGRGIVATCLIVRGTLKPGALLIAGTSTCKVRSLTDDKGKTVKSALPGFPVVVTGWKEVPSAGDEILQASSELDLNNAVKNRERQIELKKQVESLDEFNEKRRVASEAHNAEAQRLKEEKMARKNAVLTGIRLDPKEWQPWNVAKEKEEETGPKELRLLVKGDVSGSVEAVVETLKTIGNDEAKVVIVGSSVGDVSKGDVAFAEAAGATIVAFSVKADRQVVGSAAVAKVPILLENVIYRLVEQVISRTEDLLPPIIEFEVNGEATVQEIFEIHVPGKKNLAVAGCRVFNGTIDKKESVRVMRNGEEIYSGKIDTLKRVKADVTEVGRGTECGMNIHGFSDLEKGDIIQSIKQLESKRKL